MILIVRPHLNFTLNLGFKWIVLRCISNPIHTPYLPPSLPHPCPIPAPSLPHLHFSQTPVPSSSAGVVRPCAWRGPGLCLGPGAFSHPSGLPCPALPCRALPCPAVRDWPSPKCGSLWLRPLFVHCQQRFSPFYSSPATGLIDIIGFHPKFLKMENIIII